MKQDAVQWASPFPIDHFPHVRHDHGMADSSDPSRVEIGAISLNLTPEVGADDLMIWVRVVPAGKEGLRVYGRSLLPDELDDGRKIVVNRSIGETLHFRPGSVRFSIQDVDRLSKAGPDGYRPITNTIWRWLSLGNPASPEQFRYLLAAGRRLDGTHAILMQVSQLMGDESGGFYQFTERFMRALALSEILAVSLGRTVDLLDGVHSRIGVALPLPTQIDVKKAGIRKLRNAFEHIEDRALGQVNGQPHPDAVSVFEQRAFITKGELTYAGFTLGLRDELPQLLLAARDYVFGAAVKIAGDARVMNVPLNPFGE